MSILVFFPFFWARFFALQKSTGTFFICYLFIFFLSFLPCLECKIEVMICSLWEGLFNRIEQCATVNLFAVKYVHVHVWAVFGKPLKLKCTCTCTAWGNLGETAPTSMLRGTVSSRSEQTFHRAWNRCPTLYLYNEHSDWNLLARLCNSTSERIISRGRYTCVISIIIFTSSRFKINIWPIGFIWMNNFTPSLYGLICWSTDKASLNTNSSLWNRGFQCTCLYPTDIIAYTSTTLLNLLRLKTKQKNGL